MGRGIYGRGTTPVQAMEECTSFRTQKMSKAHPVSTGKRRRSQGERAPAIKAGAQTPEQMEVVTTLMEEPVDLVQFRPLTGAQLSEILALTIKKDNANKLVSFLCQLSAYTEDAPFNVSYNAPSSTGKSYIPTEIAALFPPLLFRGAVRADPL